MHVRRFALAVFSALILGFGLLPVVRAAAEGLCSISFSQIGPTDFAAFSISRNGQPFSQVFLIGGGIPSPISVPVQPGDTVSVTCNQISIADPFLNQACAFMQLSIPLVWGGLSPGEPIIGCFDGAGESLAGGVTGPTTDASAPLTTATLGGSLGNNGWYTSPVQVALNATDADGPQDVAGTVYTVDGGATQDYIGPFTLSGNGQHVVSFQSIDLAGNLEAEQTSTIKIDSTPPAGFGFSISPANKVLTPRDPTIITVTISGYVTDALPGSGLESSSGLYSVQDSYGTYQPTGTFTINPADGSFTANVQVDTSLDLSDLVRTYRITLQVRDVAGNTCLIDSTVTIGSVSSKQRFNIRVKSSVLGNRA
jgi:hypothetical protein